MAIHTLRGLVLLISIIASTLLTLPPTNGEQLIQAMQQRYAGKWYKTLTFVQTTTFPQTRQGGDLVRSGLDSQARCASTWPRWTGGRTILFRNDSIYQFKGGKLAGSKNFVASPDGPRLRRLWPAGRARRSANSRTWDSISASCVPIPGRDARICRRRGPGRQHDRSQFWIDQERLLFVRMIEPAPDGSGATFETQFNKYQPLGKGWISVEVIFNVNGKTDCNGKITPT